MEKLDEITEKLFTKATGKKEQLPFGEERIVPYVRWRNGEQIGKYNINNGVLGFANEKREYWVLKSKDDLTDGIVALEKAGYKQGEVYVAFSMISQEIE